MRFLILDKKDSLKKHLKLLDEEVEELKHEVLSELLTGVDRKEKTISECLDVIQVCVGLLDELKIEESHIIKHNNKLIGRGWKIKSMLEVKR